MAMLACAACCFATSLSSKAKSQPSTSTALTPGASAPVPRALRNSSAICVTSPGETGASTAPTCTMRPCLMPCSHA